jgi:hypothetical protein
MKTYLIAYYNWYDEVIQTSVETTDNILDFLREECLPKFSTLTTADAICDAEVKRGGFLGYLEV